MSSPAWHAVVYNRRTGQTHLQLLCEKETELGNLGRRVLNLEPVLAGEKEKEPSHTCEVVTEKLEPGLSQGESWDRRVLERMEGEPFTSGGQSSSEEAAWSGCADSILGGLQDKATLG